MTCDHDLDEAAHAVECPECQERLGTLQKLRSRLAPPPSPLGADFARRTADRVLRESLVAAQANTLRKQTELSWYQRLTDNPLVHIVRRERNRHMFRLPKLIGVLLAFLIPGSLVTMSGNVEAQWSYFGTVRLGLMLVLPLYLLSLELATLTSLVRGRCLEEILHTGMEPRNVCDTLAANGLRALLPASAAILVALFPAQTDSTSALTMMAWLPLSLLTYWSCSYLSQAHLLVPGWNRFLSATGVLLAAVALGAGTPYNFAAAIGLTYLGYRARQTCCAGLTDVQSGRVAARAPRARPGWSRALACRLPDDALLQRELLRHPGLVMSPWVLGGGAAILAMLVYTNTWASEPSLWMGLAGVVSMFFAENLVSREKESGTYDVLVHSGLAPADWIQSAFRLNLLRLLPLVACGAVGLGLAARDWTHTGFLSLGILAAFLVTVWSGSVIGVWAGMSQSGRRAALGGGFKQCAIAALYAMLGMSVAQTMVGEYSVLSRLVSDWNLYALAGGLSILSVMLAGYARARQLQARLARQGARPPYWLASCLACVPALLLLGSEARGEGWFGSVAVCWVLVLCWCFRPLELRLQRLPESPRRHAALLLLSVLAGCLATGLTFWTAWGTLLSGVNYQLGRLVEHWAGVDYAQTLSVLTLWTVTCLLLAKRNGWFAQVPAPSGKPFKVRAATLAAVLCVPGLFTGRDLLGLMEWQLQQQPTAPEYWHQSRRQFVESSKRPRVFHVVSRVANDALWGNLNPWLTDRPPNYGSWQPDELLTTRFPYSDLAAHLRQNPEVGPALRNHPDAEHAAFYRRTRYAVAFEARRSDDLVQALGDMKTAAVRTAQAGLRADAELQKLEYLALAFAAVRTHRLTGDGLEQVYADQARLATLDQFKDTAIAAKRTYTYFELLPAQHRRSRARLQRPFSPDTLLGVYQLAQANQFAYYHADAERYVDNIRAGFPLQPFESELARVVWVQRARAAKLQLLEAACALAVNLERQRMATGSYPAKLANRHKDVRVDYRVLEDSYSLKLRRLGRGTQAALIFYTRGEGYKIIEGNPLQGGVWDVP